MSQREKRGGGGICDRCWCSSSSSQASTAPLPPPLSLFGFSASGKVSFYPFPPPSLFLPEIWRLSKMGRISVSRKSGNRIFYPFFLLLPLFPRKEEKKRSPFFRRRRFPIFFRRYPPSRSFERASRSFPDSLI